MTEKQHIAVWQGAAFMHCPATAVIKAAALPPRNEKKQLDWTRRKGRRSWARSEKAVVRQTGRRVSSEEGSVRSSSTAYHRKLEGRKKRGSFLGLDGGRPRPLLVGVPAAARRPREALPQRLQRVRPPLGGAVRRQHKGKPGPEQRRRREEGGHAEEARPAGGGTAPRTGSASGPIRR